MFVTGVSAKGKTRMRFVEKGAKINSGYYINKVLRPIFEEDNPKLFGKDTSEVIFHYDSAPSHTHKKRTSI